MKRFLALVLSIVFVLGLTGCATNITGHNETPIDNSTNSSSPDTTSTTPLPVDNDETIKTELLAKVGLPFRLWKTEDMSLWCITILENSAEREYSNSMEGQFVEKSLTWQIENGELIIDGEWNESFTLDLEKMEAISKEDGKVYSIVKGDS